mmetsp:Transcript_6752/g.19650  ORF Transcript_6752/g.19650 Transcript_6752/m.19650 type:complete len:485 (+) Transcript_6752:138-1592(+)
MDGISQSLLSGGEKAAHASSCRSGDEEQARAAAERQQSAGMRASSLLSQISLKISVFSHDCDSSRGGGTRQRTMAVLSWLAQPEPAAVCRFCHSCDETPETGIFLAPCGCRGTLRWVHKACLGGWVCAPGRRKALCDVCRTRYDVGPRGPFRLPVGLIPDAILSVSYSLLGCLPLLVGVLFGLDDTNILARGFPLHRVISTAILVGLTLGAFDWLAGRQHGGSASLRCGVRMAIAFIATVAGAPLAVFGTEMWAAGGGLRAWLMLEAVCDKPRWFLSASVLYYFYLFCISATFLPYCLLNGRRVHQATREALLRLRHRRGSDAAAAGGSIVAMESLYVREGAYYILIAIWSLTHIVFWEVILGKIGPSLIPPHFVVALLVAVSVWKRPAIGKVAEELRLFTDALAGFFSAIALLALAAAPHLVANVIVRWCLSMVGALEAYDNMGLWMLVLWTPFNIVVGLCIPGAGNMATFFGRLFDHLRPGL